MQTEAQTATPPRQGEPCEGCGAPLASDQRYCLNCGRRRGEPRVDYRYYMATANASARTPEPRSEVAEEPEASPAEKSERDYAPLAAVGGIAVLGLMLLVGVLIGKGNSGPASTPPPVVVRGGTGGEPAAESARSAEADGGSKATAGGGTPRGADAKRIEGGLMGGNADGTDATVQASDSELEALESESGASYEEKSRNLPNKIATPGKPPPIDTSTPPGGGEGGGEVIK